MSELKKRLAEELKTAMKGGDKERVVFARSLHAAIRKKEIDDRIDLDDQGFQSIVSFNVKQRNDSIEQFKKGGREDLVENETKELEFLMTYLPPQLSDDELNEIIKKAISSVGASSPKDMGKVMQVLKDEVQGRADGKRISTAVKTQLT